MGVSETITSRMARFAVETDPATIPAPALVQAQGAVADTLAVTLAGSQEVSAKIGRQWAAEMGAEGASRILGTPVRTAPSEAAFANGIAAHALDFDDTHPHFSHASATLVSALLPVGQAIGASGEALVHAYVFGLEIGTRLGRAIGHGHYMRGWHVSATIGVFAATAALARLQGLSADQLSTAWGIAGSMTSGLIRNFGTMTKPFHLGHAAGSAVKAAWLARNGFSADQTMFEGPGGFLQVYGENDGEPLEALADTLGTEWELVEPGLYTKGWPCCYCNHRPVGGLFRLIEEHGLSAGDVEEIRVGFLPGADKPLVKVNPQTGLEGKFSIEYAAAAALIDGRLDLDSFTDEAVQRPEIRKMMKRVSRYRIPADKMYSGIAGFMDLAVKTPRGTHEMRIETMPGSLEWPLSPSDKATKFMTCAMQVLSTERADRLHALTGELPSLADIDVLAEAAAP